MGFARIALVVVALTTVTQTFARQITAIVTDGQQQPVAEATVIATSGYRKAAEAKTDAAGTAVLEVPDDAKLRAVVALRNGVGMDYVLFRGEGQPRSNPNYLESDHANPISFTLDGVRTARIRLVDAQDRPVTGETLTPWLLTRPNKPDQFNTAGLREFDGVTNEEGVATLDTIPADNLRTVTIWARCDGYEPERIEFDPAGDGQEIVVKLRSLVQLSGRVTFQDGRPAGGIEVSVVGDGHSLDDFQEKTRTDAEGRFKLRVNPNHYYLFAAGNREFAAPAVNKIVRNDPVDDVELVLQPATRVHGRVVVGPTKQPSPKTYVQLYRESAVEYYDLPKESQLPNPDDSSYVINPLIVVQTTTDSDGAFEFFTGPGKYYLLGPRNIEASHFEIGDQSSVEINLHAPREEYGIVCGRVVMADDPTKPVAKAIVGGSGTSQGLRDLSAVSDDDGRFESKRGLEPMVVYARSADSSLAGVTNLGADDQEVTIAVVPTASARGRLIDEATQQPIADRQVNYGIKITLDGGAWTYRFGGSTTTDAAGNFAIDGLVPGQSYPVNAVSEFSAGGEPRGWRTVSTVNAPNAETVELGDVVLTAPYREPTTEERVAKAFTAEQSLEERLKARLRDARFGYQRVLAIVGDPTDVRIQAVYDLEYDDTIGDAAMHYLYLPVNISDDEQREKANATFASWNVTPPIAAEPVLVILDPDGTVVSHQPLAGFASGDGVDAEKLREFLDTHAPTLPDAEALLADALIKAKSEGKRVFVQHSGPRCGWCFVLSRFLDDHHDLVNKEFVWVKLDGRMKNGETVINRVRTNSDGGIPWFAFLDADGNEIINSEGPDGNIGYPGEPESQVHFEKMLRTSPRHLTDADIAEFTAALKSDDD
jgi:hypothetical protein